MVISSQYDRHLVFLTTEGKQTPFKIIGFDVSEKGDIRPLTYPTPPKGARLYSVEADGFRLFDLASGTTSGHGLIAPE